MYILFIVLIIIGTAFAFDGCDSGDYATASGIGGCTQRCGYVYERKNQCASIGIGGEYGMVYARGIAQ